MKRHPVWATVILIALSASRAGLYAEEPGTKCTVSLNRTGESFGIRDAPNDSARLLSTFKPNQTEIRELDIVSRSAKGNDWMKVKIGTVGGWVNASALQCRLSPEEARTEIAAETAAVIEALRNKDMEALAKYVHPIKGVRFSPSATVGPSANVILRQQELRPSFQSAEKRIWGSDDAKGEPIRLTTASYYARFIYNRDFRMAPVVGFNAFQAKSTDRNNVWEVYPNAIIVEYYFPPSVRDGNDWAGLRLVYEKHAGRWFLSGVIHDAWTI